MLALKMPLSTMLILGMVVNFCRQHVTNYIVLLDNLILLNSIYLNGMGCGNLPQWARSMIGTALRETSVSNFSSLILLFIIFGKYTPVR